MGRQSQNKWTEEDEEIALRLLAQKARPDAYLRLLGRSKANADAHFYYKNHKAAINEKDRQSRKESSNKIKGPVHSVAQPDDAMVTDATYRLTAPRTLTSWVCGDPAPGYSALERKQGERQ